MEKDSGFQPPKKKRRKEDLPPEKHFICPVSNDQLAVISKGFIPLKRTPIGPWVVSENGGVLRDRKSTEEDKCQCPENLWEDPDSQELNYWISCFVAEFETKTLPLRTILAGLQRYMLAKNPSAPKFLDKGETCFSDSWHLRYLYRDLRAQKG